MQIEHGNEPSGSMKCGNADLQLEIDYVVP
jgi:hypothetical protein